MERLRTKRPMHPGELLQRLLKQLKISQGTAAKHLDCSRVSINLIVNGKQAVTPVMALKLAHVFGTSAELWYGMQKRLELFDARIRFAQSGVVIKPLEKKVTICGY